MTSRPLDSAGDVLPVLEQSDIITGPLAAQAALRDHLRLYSGEWWEYAEKGNKILDLLSSSRYTEQEAAALISYLTSYILTLNGISSVSDSSVTFSDHRLSFSCTVHTEEGYEVTVGMLF